MILISSSVHFESMTSFNIVPGLQWNISTTPEWDTIFDISVYNESILHICEMNVTQAS